MTYLLYLLLLLLSPFSDYQVSAMVSTAPDYLTMETARDHLAAAVAAGTAHDVRPDILLSIAYHESRYAPGTVTPEPGHRVSCGVMTPVPQASCSRLELSVVGGYDHGAAHIAAWRQYYPGRELLAYAGGGGLVSLCARSPGRQECEVARVFEARARKIAGALGWGPRVGYQVRGEP